jgi:hypothetical protein
VRSREDVLFTIGYDGPVALVDGKARKEYGKCSTQELAEKGLFRAAWASALYNDNDEEKRVVISAWNTLTKQNLDMSFNFSRLFGVYISDIPKSKIL